jgi:peptide/nickel transport system substrate-binding protein
MDTRTTIRVAIPQTVANLTPYSPGVPETLIGLVYDNLAAPSPYAGDATPWLARSIDPDGDDGRSWRIALRDGIRWHDGVPFSAADVVFTLRIYRDGPVTRWSHHVGDTPKLVGIEPLDRLSLRVTCEHPCPLFDKVTAADMPILPAHLWQTVTEPHLYSGPLVGTGPFRVTEMAAGRFVRLAANRDYFAGTPRVSEIVVSFIRNPATAFAALRADELDLVVAPVPPELLASLPRQPGLAVRRGAAQPLSAIEMRLNFDRAPFTDPAFRRAVALAIRPGEVLQRVALGKGRPGSIGYPPPSPWTAPGLVQPSDDPRAAVRLFDARGFRDRDGDGWREDTAGAPLRLGIKVASNEPLQLRAAQVVERQLAAVGLRARADVVDPARLRALYTARQFDLLLGEVTAHTLVDPDQLVVSFMTGYLWRHGLSNPRIEAALARWQAATTPQARIDAGFALQRLHEEAPVVLMLYYPATYQAYRPGAYDGWRGMPGMGLFHKWSLVALTRLVPPWAPVPAGAQDDRQTRAPR